MSIYPSPRVEYISMLLCGIQFLWVTHVFFQLRNEKCFDEDAEWRQQQQQQFWRWKNAHKERKRRERELQLIDEEYALDDDDDE